jgi:putative hemolysin
MALFEKLRLAHLVGEDLRTVPHEGHALPRVEAAGCRTVRAPRLLQTYLELSAKICGPPAIDREFKTIDFLTLLDLEDIPARLRTRLKAE